MNVSRINFNYSLRNSLIISINRIKGNGGKNESSSKLHVQAFGADNRQLSKNIQCKIFYRPLEVRMHLHDEREREHNAYSYKSILYVG